jgi:hypothetical protein
MKLSEREVMYLCGFLDGDGSIITQIVRDKTYHRGFYIRIGINFHQSTKRHWFILHLKRLLKVGSITTKKDGMSLYTITGKKPVKSLLTILKPHLIIKKSLARLVLRIIERNETVSTDAEFIEVCKLVDKTAELTDSKKRIITSQTVTDFLTSRAQTEIDTEL